jgi:hypothetical protein
LKTLATKRLSTPDSQQQQQYQQKNALHEQKGATIAEGKAHQ